LHVLQTLCQISYPNIHPRELTSWTLRIGDGTQEGALMASILNVGIGHVGLPLSLKLWEAGHDVALVDINESKIHQLRSGRMPFSEDGCDLLLARATGDARFRPLTYTSRDFRQAVSEAEYVVMTLGTPLGSDYTFRFDQYFDVLGRLSPLLKQGVTLIVRSTVAPHFTRNVVATRVATERGWTSGIDFFVCFCPERLSQGRALRDIDDLPEIIGADDEGSAERVAVLFRSLGDHKQLIHVSTIEAELAKLFLNTFRYSLFGLANEFAQISEQYGADVYRVLEAANTDYPRGGIPTPGPARGPCLGKDTATLAFSTTASLISHAAIKTNENIVLHTAESLRAALGSFAHRHVSVLGLAFKADTDDTRDNMSTPLLNLLEREGAATAVYDPLVLEHSDPGVLAGSDAVVLMTAHAEFRRWDEARLLVLCARRREELFVFDLWNVWPWADRILGRRSEIHDHPGYRRLRLADASRRASPA
jgi:UDP-N-acetyl-D-mannosaminuronic acid dehydrogenase